MFEPLDPDSLDLDTLNPGIWRTVLWLRGHGFNTCDSGDGVTNVAAGMEGARDHGHVVIQLESRAELFVACDRIVELLAELDVSTAQPGGVLVQGMYVPGDVPIVDVSNVTDEVMGFA